MEEQKMNFRRLLLIAVVVTTSSLVIGQSKTAPKKTSQTAQKASQPTDSSASDGERVFKQNCSRCHNAPEGFSPSISGTIVRHMRVRANLSERDVQALLRFFNP